MQEGPGKEIIHTHHMTGGAAPAKGRSRARCTSSEEGVLYTNPCDTLTCTQLGICTRAEHCFGSTDAHHGQKGNKGTVYIREQVHFRSCLELPGNLRCKHKEQDFELFQ